MVEERLCLPMINGEGSAVPWWDWVCSLRLFSLRLEKLMKPFPTPQSVGKLSSVKPIPGAKKARDFCLTAQERKCSENKGIG